MTEENEHRYDELNKRPYYVLVENVIELEDSITKNDEEMQKVYAANESMLKQLDEIRAENHALKRKLEEMMYLKKRHVDRNWLAIYSPEYYLRTYANYSKEDLMLEIMDLRITLRGMFHD